MALEAPGDEDPAGDPLRQRLSAADDRDVRDHDTRLVEQAELERELELLSKSELPPDEWLAAVGVLDVQQATQNVTTGEESLKIQAILLLRARS